MPSGLLLYSIGFSYMQSSMQNGERESTAKAYLRPVIDRTNLHISINTFVTKVVSRMLSNLNNIYMYNQSECLL